MSKPKKNPFSKKGRNVSVKLTRAPNPGVYEGKQSEAVCAIEGTKGPAFLSAGELPLLPTFSGQDQTLLAYIERLSEECEIYFPRFAQDHMVMLRQRRYDEKGELTEVCTCQFGSPSMSREHAIGLVKECLHRLESDPDFDFRLAKGEDADQLALFQAQESENTEESEVQEKLAFDPPAGEYSPETENE